MAWRKPPADASDRELAEEYHLYKVAPGREPAVSVTKIISPLTDANMLSQAKAKQTAAIAALEAVDRPQHIAEHRVLLKAKYEEWKPWQHKKWEKVDLTDNSAVYFDWLRMEVERRWKMKADLGSRVHAHVYDLSMGNDVDALDDELPYVDAWARYAEENGVEFIPSATERVVVHPAPKGDESLEYGGRDDLFAIHHKGSLAGPVIGDYKTGGVYPTQVTLQLSGYGFGFGFATYDELGAITDQYDEIPQWDKAVGIYLHDDGTYHVHEVPSDADAYNAFLELRSVINFQTKMKPYEKKAEAEWKANQAK